MSYAPTHAVRLLFPGGLLAAGLITTAAVVLAVGLVWWLPQSRTAAVVRDLPHNETIESKWGVRYTMVGLTADGGLLDVRYEVLDPDKAEAIVDDPTNPPALVDEATGERLTTLAQMPQHNLQAGRTFFFLYHNPGAVLHRGSLVTIELADGTRLEHAGVL